MPSPGAPDALARVNDHWRAYRVKKVHGLLVNRHAGNMGAGRMAAMWWDKHHRCRHYYKFEIGCDNGERVQIAFTLDWWIAKS